jgi:hypothetical protein
MRVEKTYTDNAWHPDRRRVKYFPVAKANAEDGQNITIDNADWVGDYPILWSRNMGNGMKLVVMLTNELTGETAHGTIHESDFTKLPETDIEW